MPTTCAPNSSPTPSTWPSVTADHRAASYSTATAAGQYTSKDFDKYCRDHEILRSLGRTGNCYDNAVAESFFATYKKELIHTRPWPTIGKLWKETHDWIENYYNTIRRHSTLGYLTPREYELGYRTINQLAA